MNGWILTALQNHDYVMEHARIKNGSHAHARRRLTRVACMTRPTKTYDLIEMETLPSARACRCWPG
jgi:hypothetical protein